MSTAQWFWMMDYCKRNLLHPGESIFWEEARKAYEKWEELNK